MSKQKLISIIIILILIAGNIFFAVQYFSAQEKFNEIKAIAENKSVNEKALNFTKLFIAEVLKAEGEVDFEARLKLENAVRDLNDEKILNQWQKFVNSQTEDSAQEEVKNLLEMLVYKIDRG